MSPLKLHENIRAARIAANLTQAKLAKRIGVKQQTIQKYENGIVTNIPSDRIEAIAKALEVTPAYLMGWEQEPSQEELTLDEQPEDVEFALWGEVKDLSDDEKQDILDFIKFKKSQRKE